MKSRKAQKDLLETVSYDGIDYPALQARGNAAKFARPLFDEVIPPGSRGYDVGFGRPEWAIREDATLVGEGEEFHALNLPAMDPMADYLFSSHCLEHIPGSWMQTVDYWYSMVRPGGVVFLYLPNMNEQHYWAFGNMKHVHYLAPDIVRDYCRNRRYEHLVTPGCDLNASFYCIIQVR